MQSKFKSYRSILTLVVVIMALAGLAWVQAAQAAPSAQDEVAWAQPTDEPTGEPTGEPTSEPTDEPTAEPTDEPTAEPTGEPTSEPTGEPTAEPTDEPTAEPTDEPTGEPTTEPTTEPTAEPTAEPTVQPTVEPPTGLIVEVTGPSEVEVGDTFLLNVVASNIPDPGIFGYQFDLNWDDSVFSAVAGSTVLNSEFPTVAKLDVGANVVEVATSRQGDVGDLTGPLTLLTIEMQANAVTDPETSTFSLTNVKLGRKGGIEVPVDVIINLDVLVTEDLTADILGNVKVEGRADDNQAGHSVVVEGEGLSATTDSNGDFVINNVPFGTYDLTADSAGFLAATCTGVAHSSSDTILANVVLLAGDIDNSGEIDITDAVAIGAVFGSTAGEVADLNIDGEVDILDLILMSANFGQTSVANPWVC
jgi:cytoskeletal protein RodZ